MATDTLRWINHAGYEIRSGDFRLVVDPWLSGRAFAGGWALLSPTKYQPEDFEGVSHIWLSHEHPDHFSPGDLRRVAPEVRSQITILYQRTRDRRVVKFCEKLGFKTLELVNNEVATLAPGITFQLGTVGHDSWSFLRTPQASYLNMNDCVHPNSTWFYRSVRRRLDAPVDVLLTQFSYASWTGNPGEGNCGFSMALQKIEQMAGQISVFSPRILIPFASYVWFCAPENHHMNQAMNTAGEIWKTFSARLETVVLYPDDIYPVGQFHDSTAAVARYEADIAAISGPLPLEEVSLTTEALLTLAEDYRTRIRKRNWLWTLRPLAWLGKLRPVTILATDLGETFEFSMFGTPRKVRASPADIETTSAVLGSLFVTGYASGALLISGRLYENVPGAMAQISRNFVALRYNEAGIYIPWDLLRPSFLMGRLE